MPRPKVDGAGQAKLDTLDDALAIAQTVHGHVEKLAVAIRNTQPTAAFGQQIRRAASPLVGLLRSQFQPISDQAADLVLIAGRAGGTEQQKLRMLRERVAQIKTAIELATQQVVAKHGIAEEPDAGPGDRPPAG